MADKREISRLNRTEKDALRRLNARLTAAGLDPAERAVLAHDYILAKGRIARLREQETKAKGKTREQVMRGLNVALAERRRLHKALFGGARNVEPKADFVETEADRAWREHLWPATSKPKAIAGAERIELERLHGEPTWAALLYATHEEACEDEALVASRAVTD